MDVGDDETREGDVIKAYYGHMLTVDDYFIMTKWLVHDECVNVDIEL